MHFRKKSPLISEATDLLASVLIINSHELVYNYLTISKHKTIPQNIKHALRLVNIFLATDLTPWSFIMLKKNKIA